MRIIKLISPKHRRYGALFTVMFGLLAVGHTVSANPIGLPGTDYNLATLMNGSSQATYDTVTGTIVTTGPKTKLLLPALPTVLPNHLRYIEVEISTAASTQVYLNWWEATGFRTSEIKFPATGSTETVAVNLSTMDASTSTMKLRIKGTPGSVISRVRLVDRPQPNIILILVDDLSFDELELGFGRSLPEWPSALVADILQQGTVLENFFNTTPLCCPSRASFLTGQYAHNHGIWGNNYNLTGGNGGWRRFWEQGFEVDSLGTWMQDAGYQTALVGKFMNGYPDKPGFFVPETYVPAGWDEWYGEFNNDAGFSYYDFRINENGTVVTYDDGTYLTDLEKTLAVDFINRTAPTAQPFFMFFTPYAPHGPTEPATRHDGMHNDLIVLPPPSFNETDLSDKPQFVQDGATNFSNYFGLGSLRKLDMTLAVDELIEAVFDTLENHNLLDETYVFFTSDNGLMRGEHAIGGKSVPYEESVRIPLIVRGPGVPAGAYRPDLVANIDLAPTILELAGAVPPDTIDGESIIEVMTGATPSENWRDAIQIELRTPISSNQPFTVPTYFGIRTNYQCYVEYDTAELELYDLVRDPFQMESQHLSDPETLLPVLQGPLTALSTCAGASCRDATRLGWPQAVATVTCDHLDCTFDSSGSSDPDGTVDSHAWDFGDSATDTGSSQTHSYAAGGDYQVILTVKDNLGNPGIDTYSINVIEPTSHLNEVLILLKLSNPNNLRAIAKMFVLDDEGAPAQGATVTGDWSINGGLIGSFSGVTNSLGRAKINMGEPTPGDQLEFCVTDITHPTLTYDPAANIATCGQAVWP